ncbi:MAG: hypothetical protein H0W88_10790 [Parachlamydiaceae bacterium]|nr:hypothetical protein [Parachlamydiaceae bacterium]
MEKLDKDTLAKWNQQGLIPGPKETEENYINRAHFCFDLEHHLIKEVGSELPFNVSDRATQEILHESYPKTENYYGITPQWTPVFFSNYQLTSWHGGCAWIFQLNESTPTASFLQLRAQFRNKETYLGIYRRSELIAHELSHVGRMMYQEPQFEEILAFQSSTSSFRRWLGPIVQSSKESLFFILLLGVIILADLAVITLDHSYSHQGLFWLKWLPVAVVALALSRLGWRHLQFNRCLKKLETIYGNKHTAQHLTYRFLDSEIKFFASSSIESIKNFISEQQTKSFRWHFLATLYPL